MMSDFTELRPRFERLLDKLLDLGLDADQQAQLNAILRDHAEARSAYRIYLAFHADMTWDGLDHAGIERNRQQFGGVTQVAGESLAAVQLAVPVPVPVPSFLGRFVPGTRATLAVSACAAAFALYVVIIAWGMLDGKARGLRLEARGEGNEPSSLKSQASSLKPAYVVASENATWLKQPQAGSPAASAANQPSIENGEELALASGIVELKLKQGVTLHIEGPAEWTIDGANRATLTRGRLLASVPKPAVGFTLKTPSARIVDLGTEFGVEVDSSRQTNVIVTQGDIALVPGSASNASVDSPDVVRLSAGQARLVMSAVDGSVTVRPLNAESRWAKQMANWSARALPKSAQENRAEDADGRRRREPILTMAYWKFDTPANLGANSSGRLNDAHKLEIGSGVTAVKGDPGDPSIGFIHLDGVGDALRTTGDLNLSITPFLTIEFFVRFENEAPTGDQVWVLYESGEDFSREPGNIIATFVGEQGGAFDAGYRTRSAYSAHQAANSATNITDGKWHHVAILYDRTTKVAAEAIRIFVDHREMPDVIAPQFLNLLDTDFHTAPLYIGARNRSSNQFKGWLDEFRISAPLLTPDEFLALPTQPKQNPN